MHVVTSSRRTPGEETLADCLVQELRLRKDSGIQELKCITTLYWTFLHPHDQGRDAAAHRVLESAVEMGKLAIVRHVLDSGLPVDGNKDSSPMLIACRRGHMEIAKFLVERGASVFAAESLRMRLYRSSMLLAVCESTCDQKFVKWLVENDAISTVHLFRALLQSSRL